MILKTLLAVTLGLAANAYVPKLNTILEHVGQTHGKGAYQIDQELAFIQNDNTFIVRESWLIEDGESMRLNVAGKQGFVQPMRMTLIYNGGKRYYIDNNGTRKMSNIGDDWSETYFLFRNAKNIRARMYADKIIPAEALRVDKTWKTAKEYFVPDYLRLSRVGGYVAYAFGEPSALEGENFVPKPGLWVEQDSFNVRKLRLPSGALVTANEYQKHSQGLEYPKQREFFWNNIKVQVTTINVKSIPAGKAVKDLLSQASLDYAKNPNLAMQLPEVPAVVEFYQRFR